MKRLAADLLTLASVALLIAVIVLWLRSDTCTDQIAQRGPAPPAVDPSGVQTLDVWRELVFQTFPGRCRLRWSETIGGPHGASHLSIDENRFVLSSTVYNPAFISPRDTGSSFQFANSLDALPPDLRGAQVTSGRKMGVPFWFLAAILGCLPASRFVFCLRRGCASVPLRLMLRQVRTAAWRYGLLISMFLLMTTVALWTPIDWSGVRISHESYFTQYAPDASQESVTTLTYGRPGIVFHQISLTRGDLIAAKWTSSQTYYTEPSRDFSAIATPDAFVDLLGFRYANIASRPELHSGGRSNHRMVGVPWWALFCMTLVIPARFVWRRRTLAHRTRRTMLGLCIHCGYDLRASIDRCPECGTPLSAKFAAARGDSILSSNQST